MTPPRSRSPWTVLFIAAAVTACLPDRVQAWGSDGHAAITQAAVPALPTPLRTYFEANLALITSSATTEPPGNHYIDIDYYPEFFAGTFPRDIDGLIALYGSGTVDNNGAGPWTAEGYYNELVAKFAAATRNAAWMDLLYTAGALAHYIEDLHNPMHLTLNYNGQLTGQNGLHSRYESVLVSTKLFAGVLQPRAGREDCVYYASFIDALFDEIDIVYPHNPAILAADLSAYAEAGDRFSARYYEHLWTDGCDEVTPIVFNQAAAMVASAWYSAWRDAGFPPPPGVASSTDLLVQMVSATETGAVVTVIGDAGRPCTLEASTNLLEWAGEVSVTNFDGRVRIDVPGASSSAVQFYRAFIRADE